ncbi:MAG: diacylglycerol kinase family protein [Candidatus Lernaella stagnicola]|nr:diacylglycerol kinase family protein [Candidatus Lernaella stagnicola]
MGPFAVAINMKARKVRKSTLEMVSQHVDVEDIYVTRTIEQSDQSLDEIIKKRYPLVLCGGGDGTAMRIIEQVRKKVARLNKKGGDYQIPRFGLLKLGTGNGWAGQLEVPPKVEPIWTLRQLRGDELRFTRFNMVESEGRLFHFGGFGVDAMILNEYIELKNKFQTGFMWKVSNSLAGYLWATFVKAAPRIAISNWKMPVRIYNNSDEPVYSVNQADGACRTEHKKGDLLYEGSAIMVGVGTTENFGFNLKAYPYACTKEGYMQLRVAQVSVGELLPHMSAVWQGKWDSDNMIDFLVKDVTVESDTDLPFQLGGDPEGYRKKSRFVVSDFMPEVLDFRR